MTVLVTLAGSMPCFFWMNSVTSLSCVYTFEQKRPTVRIGRPPLIQEPPNFTVACMAVYIRQSPCSSQGKTTKPILASVYDAAASDTTPRTPPCVYFDPAVRIRSAVVSPTTGTVLRGIPLPSTKTELDFVKSDVTKQLIKPICKACVINAITVPPS